MNAVMAEAMRNELRPLLPAEDEARAPRPRVAADWPLMGDILTHRMEMPEHLIRWRRAEQDSVRD